MRQLGDRRTRVRLEVVGTLWGALEVTDSARVVNLSDTGALIAAPIAPPVDSIQSIQLRLDGRDVRIDARVRHLRQAPPGFGPSEFFIGLEFLPEAVDKVGALG